jgi:two-component system, OmpR family, phosphate regulon sensor histidine kinase PhoR
MKRRTLFWKIYPYYFIIIVVSLYLTALYASREIRNIYIDETARTLRTRAKLAEEQIRPNLVDGNIDEINRICREIGKLTDTRITIIAPDGLVLGDSDEDPNQMENHGKRPEIVQAYAGKRGLSTRYSNTLQKNMMYVALPIADNGTIIGVIRTSLPVSEIDETVSSFYTKVLISGVIILLLAAIFSVFIFHRLTRPIRELQQGAVKFAKGQLDTRLPVTNTEEIAVLAESMNHMAEQLDNRIRTIIEQRNERETILSSMSEGVLALDNNDNIVTLNRAAAELLQIDSEEAINRSVHEVIRVADLHDFTGRIGENMEMAEMEITLPGLREQFIQVHGTALKNSAGRRIGLVMVLNDITRLKKLENIRRDFVANVSHELKTPITAIIGSAETLLEGAPDNPEDYRRFLEMIARHADRLNILVEDLLSLTRLESESIGGSLKKSREKIVSVIDAAVQACQEKIETKNINIEITCEDSLEADINSFQLEQAIINLIDNAIKYSDSGSLVSIMAAPESENVLISVTDNGCGIEARHLPRLFERFYRVDKARSRDIGGTGLGLAIVKHVALAHGGKVSVDSIPGHGSIFCIYIPISE